MTLQIQDTIKVDIRGDQSLVEAFLKWCMASKTFPIKGTLWVNGTKGDYGGVFGADKKKLIKRFFERKLKEPIE